MDFGPLDYLCLFGEEAPEPIEASDFEEALEIYLSEGLEGVPVWALKVPEDQPDLPAVVYTTITSEPVNTLRGGAGLVRVEVQVDCYADTRAAAFRLSESVRGLLHGKRGDINGVYFSSILLDNRYNDQEPSGDGSDSSTWITRCDYTLYYNESIPQF